MKTERKQLFIFLFLILVIFYLSACSTLLTEKVTIAENEVGVLYNPTGESQLLETGTHRVLRDSRVAIYSLEPLTYVMSKDSLDGKNDEIQFDSTDGKTFAIGVQLEYQYSQEHILDLHKNWVAFSTDADHTIVIAMIRPYSRGTIRNALDTFDAETLLEMSEQERTEKLFSALYEKFLEENIEITQITILDFYEVQ